MGGREEVEVEMNKYWEENLRHLGLVGVVFLPGKTQQSARDKHIFTRKFPHVRFSTMYKDNDTNLSKERRVSAGLESLRKTRKTGLCTT